MGILECNRLERSYDDSSWRRREYLNEYKYTFESSHYLEYIRRNNDNSLKKEVIDQIASELIQTLTYFLEYDPKLSKDLEKTQEQVVKKELEKVEEFFEFNDEEIYHEEIIL